MAPKFGTSGLRGLVTDLTPAFVARYVKAFLASCDTGGVLCVGRDLRPSSPEIAATIIETARAQGYHVIDCREVPTPALALAAAHHGGGAIMVTGSHIPADRNGLKFYTLGVEITKDDEQAITAALDRNAAPIGEGRVTEDAEVGARFIARYLDACGPTALAGKRIGLYSHSAVGRDMMNDILRGLGAEVVELGRSDIFIPVDTEAVAPDTRAQIEDWVKTHKLDALVSTDGDSDRPLLADETGAIVPGDVMGQIVAEALGAEIVVTPISSNSAVTMKGFASVVCTKIGSPYVISGMESAGGKVVGYEANGGFLLGFEARGPQGSFAPLMTRDCVLPLIMALIAAGDNPLSTRVRAEPPVVTLADRLQDVPQQISQPFVRAMAQDLQVRQDFLSGMKEDEHRLDLTDGVRMILSENRVVHIRPSGNAPELRLYVEARDLNAAQALMRTGMTLLRNAVEPTA